MFVYVLLILINSYIKVDIQKNMLIEILRFHLFYFYKKAKKLLFKMLLSKKATAFDQKIYNSKIPALLVLDIKLLFIGTINK